MGSGPRRFWLRSGEGMFGKIRNGLRKTREALSGKVSALLSGGGPADEEALETLEEALLTADVGIATIHQLLDRLPREARASGEALRETLRQRMMALWPEAPPPEGPPPGPWVHLMVGVNGVGKTTTLGKLAAQRTSNGQRGCLAAADTFRAAAVEQLEIWAGRARSELIRQREGRCG